MAGGPLLQFWDSALASPLVKDLRIRFAIVMLGNVVAILFVIFALKKFVPGLEVPFDSVLPIDYWKSL